MKQLKWISLSIVVLALLLGTEVVNAYMMAGYGYGYPMRGYYAGSYYPTRNYYMMDYYNQYPYQSYNYNPYMYSYSGSFYGNYYNDPNWKYYTLDSFMRGQRYGFY